MPSQAKEKRFDAWLFKLANKRHSALIAVAALTAAAAGGVLIGIAL